MVEKMITGKMQKSQVGNTAKFKSPKEMERYD